MWTRVEVLNSFLRLSNTSTLILREKALIFQAFSFPMHGPVIHITKAKNASLVVKKRKIPSFEPFVQISLSTLSFAHGAIQIYPVSCSWACCEDVWYYKILYMYQHFSGTVARNNIVFGKSPPASWRQKKTRPQHCHGDSRTSRKTGQPCSCEAVSGMCWMYIVGPGRCETSAAGARFCSDIPDER